MIRNIKDALEKRGQKYIDKFLNSNLVISEKLDMYRIVFVKKHDQLFFYKKDNTLIDNIEILLNNIWEYPQKIISSKKELIPEDLYFGISFLCPEKYKIIPYDNFSNLILTDITIRNNNKIVKKLNNSEVKEYANKLNLLPPPIIFEGYLNDKQKEIIYKYINKETNLLLSDILNEYFKTYSKFPLIKGLIFENTQKLFQLESYEYNILANSYEKKYTPNRVFYDIIIIELIKFLKTYEINSPKAFSYDDKYIEIINDIFLNFIKTFKVGDIDKKYLSPEYLNSEINYSIINNKNVIQIFEKNELYKYIYKILINSLKKEKKPFSMLTQENVFEFNVFVKKIKQLIYENS